MKKDVIAVFDIGKTNKKILLFDEQLQVVYEKEQKFPEIKDDDGFECDDIDALEKWMFETLERLLLDRVYTLKALNFTTYGATLAYLDSKGVLRWWKKEREASKAEPSTFQECPTGEQGPSQRLSVASG